MSEIADRYRKIAAGFTERVAAVPEDAWERPSPCEGWVARDVVRHLVGWLPTFFPEDAGVRVPSGPPVDDNPLGAWEVVRDVLQAALDDPEVAGREFERHPPGRFTVEQAVDTFMTSDILIHTWDLARATGLDETLDPDEVRRLVQQVEQTPPEVVKAMQNSGHYGPHVAVHDEADDQTKLLAFMGRAA